MQSTSRNHIIENLLRLPAKIRPIALKMTEHKTYKFMERNKFSRIIKHEITPLYVYNNFSLRRKTRICVRKYTQAIRQKQNTGKI